MRSALTWLPLSLMACSLMACVPTPPSNTAGPAEPTGSVMPTNGQPAGGGNPTSPPDAAGKPPPPGEGTVPNMPGGGNPAEPCGDGVCDEPEQENPELCPRDCQDKPTQGDDWCGDGICDAKESLDASCPADCADGVPAGAPGPGSTPPEGGPPPAQPPPEAPPQGDAPEGPPPEGAPTVPPAEAGDADGTAAPPAP